MRIGCSGPSRLGGVFGHASERSTDGSVGEIQTVIELHALQGVQRGSPSMIALRSRHTGTAARFAGVDRDEVLRSALERDDLQMLLATLVADHGIELHARLAAEDRESDDAPRVIIVGHGEPPDKEVSVPGRDPTRNIGGPLHPKSCRARSS